MKNKIMDRYYKGCALDAYELFGAHLCEERGKKGVRFTVYAPHAQGIQVIGSFDDWSCKGHQMRRKDDKGIWSLFVAEAKEGDKMCIRDSPYSVSSTAGGGQAGTAEHGAGGYR